MMKIGIISTCLITWIALGSMYYGQQCCTEDVTATGISVNLPFQSNTFLLSFPALSLEFESEGAILFQQNDTEPIIPERISETFIEIVKVLKVNPLFRLKVQTGVMNTEDQSLSSSRFEALRSVFERTGLPSYQISRGLDIEPIDTKDGFLAGLCQIQLEHIEPIRIADTSNSLDILIEDNISFAINSVDFLTKFQVNTRDQFQKMAQYLIQHPDRQIQIIGYYLPYEENTSSFPDMGLSRANKIRGLISSLGAKGGQIDIISQIDSSTNAVCYSKLVDTFLRRPIRLMTDDYTRANYQKQWRDQKRYEEKFTNDQVYRFLNFGSEEMSLELDQRLRSNLLAVNTYLVRNPKAKIFLVGHSNNYYDREKNYSLGYDRSRFIKDFLISNGFDTKRIIVRSMGARYPLGSDKTLFGQKHNRRVDLFISFDGKETWYYDSRYDKNYQKNLKENKR